MLQRVKEVRKVQSGILVSLYTVYLREVLLTDVVKYNKYNMENVLEEQPGFYPKFKN